MPLDTLGLTALIRRWRGSTRMRGHHVANDLFERIYGELVTIASQADYTKAIDPRDLVNQLYVKWQGDAALRDWNSRREFFAFARKALRNLVIDHYRHDRRLNTLLPFDEKAVVAPRTLSFVDFDEIITQIGAETPVFGEVLTLKVYSFYTNDQIAEALGVSKSAAKRYFHAAKIKFYEKLTNNPPLI